MKSMPALPNCWIVQQIPLVANCFNTLPANECWTAGKERTAWSVGHCQPPAWQGTWQGRHVVASAVWCGVTALAQLINLPLIARLSCKMHNAGSVDSIKQQQ